MNFVLLPNNRSVLNIISRIIFAIPLLWAFFILSIIFPAYVFASESIPLALSARVSEYSAAGYISYFEDVENKLTLKDAIKKHSENQFIYAGDTIPSFGVSHSIYWFHVSVSNPEDTVQHWLLELQDPLFDHVDIFYVKNNNVVKHKIFGDHYPLAARDYKVPNPVLNLNIESQEILNIYIRIRTFGSIYAPIVFWKYSAYTPSVVNKQMKYGLYFGIILALLLYNLMLFFSIRDINYFYYCLCIGGYAFSQFSYSGFGYQYLWPNYGQMNLYAVFCCSVVSIIFILQFTRSFIRIKENFPKINKIMLVMILFCTVPLLFFIFIDKTTAIRLNAVSIVSSLTVVFMSGFFALYKGVREARYFMLAWLVFLIGLSIFQLMVIGLLPANTFTIHGQQIGSAMEAILLSFALAHRMRLLMEENDRIQTKAKEDLEIRVKERTEELNTAMQDLAVANTQLKESSYYDGLTGIRNRQYFDDQYEKEWLRSRREKNSIALLMLDIDHFKSVNDRYGHVCGDSVLRFFAKVIREAINRPSDIVARYGGEEFIVVLPNTDIAGACALAEKVRSKLESCAITANGQKIYITTSIGCAAQVPNFNDNDELWLVNAADKALYVAKNGGRNKVQASA